MKHSHTQTPRTMRDGTWTLGSTSEPVYRESSNAVIYWPCGLAALFLAVLLIAEAL